MEFTKKRMLGVARAARRREFQKSAGQRMRVRAILAVEVEGGYEEWQRID
jgi:hypothetical protein